MARAFPVCHSGPPMVRGIAGPLNPAANLTFLASLERNWRPRRILIFRRIAELVSFA